jgi:hypothetical protein
MSLAKNEGWHVTVAAIPVQVHQLFSHPDSLHAAFWIQHPASSSSCSHKSSTTSTARPSSGTSSFASHSTPADSPEAAHLSRMQSGSSASTSSTVPGTCASRPASARISTSRQGGGRVSVVKVPWQHASGTTGGQQNGWQQLDGPHKAAVSGRWPVRNCRGTWAVHSQ